MIHSQKRRLVAAGAVFLAMGGSELMSGNAMADWQVSPKLSLYLSESYDDNIGSEEEGRFDTVTALKIQPEIALESDITSIAFGGGTAFQFYTNNSEFNSPSYSAFMNLRRRITERTVVSLQESLSYSPEAVEFLDIQQRQQPDEEEGEGASITTKRSDQISNSARLSVRIRSSERTQEQISYSIDIQGFEDPTLADSVTHAVSGSVQHDLTRSTALSGRYGYRYVNNRKEEDAQTHQASLGVTRSLSESTTVGGRGAAIYAIEPEGATGTAGGGISLTNNLGELMKMNIGYTSSVSPSLGLSADLVRYQTVQGSVSRALSRNAAATVSGRYGTSRSISTDRIKIESWGVSVGLGYAFSDWLKGSLGYRHAAQISEGEAGNNLRRNQYTAGLSAVFE